MEVGITINSKEKVASSNQSQEMSVLATVVMDLIHYSFAPLISFCVPYMFDLLPYYHSIANGTGDVGIFELLVFQCFV